MRGAIMARSCPTVRGEMIPNQFLLRDRSRVKGQVRPSRAAFHWKWSDLKPPDRPWHETAKEIIERLGGKVIGPRSAAAGHCGGRLDHSRVGAPTGFKPRIR
jgi:hypothetical protein